MLSRFAFFVALPPLLFLSVAANDPADILNWGFIWRYELATMIMFLLAALVADILSAQPGRAGEYSVSMLLIELWIYGCAAVDHGFW